MEYIALNIRWDNDDIDTLYNDELFIELPNDERRYSHSHHVFITEKKVFDRLCKISKLTKRNTKRFEDLSKIVNQYSIATIHDNNIWTPGKYIMI